MQPRPAPQPTDDAIAAIRRVRAGDRDAFRPLVQRYQKPLFGFVTNLIRDADAAEDIVQDVFCSAYAGLDAYDARRGSFSTWLFTIARNRCFTWLARARTSLSEPVLLEPRTPLADASERELFQRLDAALDALPLAQRTAFVLAELQGLPHAEVARIEGTRLGTIKSRVARARERLRGLLFGTEAV